MERTLNLVEDFIQTRIRDYREPPIYGNPNKTPIGDSTARYAAGLYLALTNLRGKEIAKRVGVSHGLIRKWSADQKFQGRMLGRLEEFKEFVNEELRREIKGQRFEFGDAAVWSSCAASRIMRAIKEYLGGYANVDESIRRALREIAKDVPAEKSKYPRASEKAIKKIDELGGYEINPQVELNQILKMLNVRIKKRIVAVLTDSDSPRRKREAALRLLESVLVES